MRDLRLEIVPPTRDPLPDGWGLIARRESYRLTAEPAEKPYSRLTLLRSVTTPGPTGANIVRPVLAERYRGHRVRLRAALRCESVGWPLEADRSDAYALSRSVTEQATGAWSDVWVLRSAGDPETGSGVLSRRVPARFFDGGGARLRARVSGHALALPAELWIRVECADRFVLGTAPSPSGTFDWTVTTAAAEVPHDATAIAYGLRLPGAGTLRVMDVSLDREPS